MNVKMLSLILSVFFLAFIVELVRQDKLTFKYAAGWLLVSLLALFLATFDGILLFLSGFFGFELASNFIFFTVLCVFVFLSLLLTIFLCQQNKRNDRIAQRLGLLEQRLSESRFSADD